MVHGEWQLVVNEYFRGVFAAYLGTGFMSHPIPEWQIDNTQDEG